MRNVLIIAIISLIGVSCNKKTKYANIPKLTFKNLSQNTIQAGTDKSIYINILFEDGDGNIGFGTNNLFLRDN
ncbi:MAG TPA: hypothetical protein PKC41_09905, partial [Chitinophagaceae bacterium]|nr:hypothetical protein [Chitinophagaceae bacterium]